MRSPENEENRTYTIGDVAGHLGVSVPTLRMYEREGLILPLRRVSGHRLYTESDIHRLHCIRRAITEDKVGIAGMRRILSLIPCWAVRGCSVGARAACPASTSHDAPCWALADRPTICTDTDCRTCPVYALSGDCTKFKTLLLSLTTTP